MANSLVRYVTLPYIGTALAAAEVTLPYAQNTAKKIWVKVSANTCDGATYFILRKNGVDTGLLLFVPSATTGVFSGTADVSVVDGDLLSISIDTTDSIAGSIAFTSVGVSFLCP
jgi:hypothetical protein